MATEQRFSFPVQVRSAGKSSFCEKENFSRDQQKDFLELFWCTEGKWEFSSGILREKEVCFYFPGDVHYIRPLTASSYCWITFDGTDLDWLIRAFAIDRRPRYAGECPVLLFEKVMAHLRSRGAENARNVSCLGYELLARATGPAGDIKNTVGALFREEVARSLGDPAFSIRSAAENLGIHRSTLVRQVMAECGVSPVEYLLSCRLQQAELLLKTTSLLVKEVASGTGFRDVNYFCRLFRKKYGVSPGAYRAREDELFQHSNQTIKQ